MHSRWSRRRVLSGLAAGSLVVLRNGRVQADDEGQGLLARLRAAKKVTVGVANNPPYSALEPDGSLTGLAPALTDLIMRRIGVPEVIGIAATYGELVPGLQAGRWDFISAALTITKQRCTQVLFSDPVLFDGGSLASLKGELANPPKTVADLVAQKLIVGASVGGALARVALDAGVSPSNLLQLPGDVAMIDSLIAKRIQVAFASYTSFGNAYRQRGLDMAVTFPIPDDPTGGAACAFRRADTDLHAAYQQELRAMKSSGEYLPIARKYGFDTPPELLPVTAEKLCEGFT